MSLQSRRRPWIRAALLWTFLAVPALGRDGPELPTVEVRTFKSAALGQDRQYSILLPVGYPASAPRRYPVLYLLHGKSGDHTDWSKRAPLRETVGSTPLIVVMPDGDDGWYLDWADRTHGYEGQIIRDLIPHVDATYRTLASREGRAVAGLSMGGYGALKLALQHPDLFVSAASHSGAVRFTREDWGREDVNAAMFGTGPESNRQRAENDLMELALVVRRRHPQWTGPAFYLDCGVDDFLYESNARLRAFFREIDVPYEYHEGPGAHSWEFWSAHLPDQLRFSLSHLAPAAP
jgi:S-formylglutathione hydrolase FrmB